MQAQLTTKRSGKKETLNVSDYSPQGNPTTNEALFQRWSLPLPCWIMDWVWRQANPAIRQWTVLKPLYAIFPLLNPPKCARKLVANLHKMQAQLTTKRFRNKGTLKVSDSSPFTTKILVSTDKKLTMKYAHILHLKEIVERESLTSLLSYSICMQYNCYWPSKDRPHQK